MGRETSGSDGEPGPRGPASPPRSIDDAAADAESPELAAGTGREPLLGRTATRHDPLTTELLAQVAREADRATPADAEPAPADATERPAPAAATRELTGEQLAATKAAAHRLIHTAETVELSERDLAAIHAEYPPLGVADNAVTQELTAEELAAAKAADPTAAPAPHVIRRPPTRPPR